MLNQIKRLSAIVNKLSGISEYISKEELLEAMSGDMAENGSYTLRTLQRDIRTIEEVFGMEIENVKGEGYRIVGWDPVYTDRFKELLSEFEILSTVGSDSGTRDYIIPEQRKMTFSVDIQKVLRSIKQRRKVRFSYSLPRLGGKEAEYLAEPYFLKQSQNRWYLVAMVEEILKCFELGRFVSFKVLDEEFSRDESVQAENLFRDCFGIWDDPKMSVEDIRLRFSPLDGRFIKTLPIHSSQKIVAETNEYVEVTLRLKITNDFVMALLSRSSSIEILAPQSLKDRMNAIWTAALERNK